MNRILRISAVVAVFGLILFAMITSSVKKPDLESSVWNSNMLQGVTEDPARHYIVYTDLMCPYCNYYAKIVQDNPEEFTTFLSEHKIAYEVRVTDMLYESSGIENSRPSAEAAYCAAREDRFWDFYHAAITALFKDYYSKGIGNSKTAEKISDMTRDYWLNIGQSVGLGDTFADCYTNQKAVAEVKANTQKAAQVTSGLPYFAFGNFTTGGFDNTWGWPAAQQMLNAGLK